MVYVIGLNNESLMPCSNMVARLLLKEKKAKVLRVTPFTIKLNYVTTTYTQPCVHGVDTGSNKIGSTVISNGEVLYTAEIKVRNDITKKMKRRLMYRRTRRNKLRYRKPRFLNRGNSTKKGRISPTVRSKIDSHLKEIRFVKTILPITELRLETASFDVHLLRNPDVIDYQKGNNYGYANVKAYVLHRDNYSCQHCGVTKTQLQVHHLIYRSNGGSDLENNLITLCKDCHTDVHNNTIVLKIKGKKSTLKHATQMNVIRSQLLKRLPEAVETFGYVTKEKRQELGLEKSHINDAIAIASDTNISKNDVIPLIKVSKCKGEYQLYKGVRSEKKIPSGKICGFRRYDRVRYRGRNYFVCGRMSSGYCTLMGIDEVQLVFDNPKTVKMKELIRIRASRTVICA